MTDVDSLERPRDLLLQIAALEQEAEQFFGDLLRKTKRDTRDGGEALIRDQVQVLIGDHRLEVARNLKDKRRESILEYVQYLANTYTNDSLREFHMYAPELLGREYAEAHNLNAKERFDEVERVSACFKDAMYLGQPFSPIYEFDDEEDLQSVSWDQLWSACGRALEVEIRKEENRHLSIAFSNDAQTLGCFVAAVLVAGDLNAYAGEVAFDEAAGRIAVVDESTLILEEGATFTVSEGVSIEGLKPGTEVTVSFEEQGGHIFATEIAPSN